MIIPDWHGCKCGFCTKMAMYFDYNDVMSRVGRLVATGKYNQPNNVDRVNGPITDRLLQNADTAVLAVLSMAVGGHVGAHEIRVELETAISMAEAADVIRQLTALDTRVEADG